MINILKKHIACYPQMQIQDLAKLLYQSEFGGGHMIADSKKSLERIQEEYRSLNLDIANSSTYIEPIGDGMCRIYLSCLTEGLQATVLNEIFVRSANHRKGSVDGLEKKIQQFLDACEKNVFSYSKEEAEIFFENWKTQGYPAISHSDIYRKNYQPAYRVVEESYGKIYEVIQTIEQGMGLANGNSPFVVAIDGMSASGKSTLGQLLHENYPQSNLFHMDDYFLQPHQRTKERLNEIGGNVDYERFKEEIVHHLANKKGITYRVYYCSTQRFGSEIRVPWMPLVIIEGAYSQHPYFGDIYALRIFCEVTKEEQRKRILIRNGQALLERFENEWIPKEQEYFEKYKINRVGD